MDLVPSIVHPGHDPDCGGSELVPVHSQLLLRGPALLGLLQPEGGALQFDDRVEPVLGNKIIRILS